MPRYVIALGSSNRLGKNYLARAHTLLKQRRDISLAATSRMVENSSFGTKFNCLFYNCVMCITSIHHPHTLYRELRTLELLLGRIRSYRNAPRTMDIDILLSLDLKYIGQNFFLPHRDMMNRNFFVMPTLEALKLAGWPIPLALTTARARVGRGYLKPVPKLCGVLE